MPEWYLLVLMPKTKNICLDLLGKPPCNASEDVRGNYRKH